MIFRYRLTSEHLFSFSLEDCWTVTKYILNENNVDFLRSEPNKDIFQILLYTHLILLKNRIIYLIIKSVEMKNFLIQLKFIKNDRKSKFSIFLQMTMELEMVD